MDAWAAAASCSQTPRVTVEVGATGRPSRCGWQELTIEIVSALSGRAVPPTFLLWGAKAQSFWDAAAPGPARVLRTRHPSYDFQRTFMADGSHFQATADLVDWWAIGAKAGRML